MIGLDIVLIGLFILANLVLVGTAFYVLCRTVFRPFESDKMYWHSQMRYGGE